MCLKLKISRKSYTWSNREYFQNILNLYRITYIVNKKFKNVPWNFPGVTYNIIKYQTIVINE